MNACVQRTLGSVLSCLCIKRPTKVDPVVGCAFACEDVCAHVCRGALGASRVARRRRAAIPNRLKNAHAALRVVTRLLALRVSRAAGAALASGVFLRAIAVRSHYTAVTTMCTNPVTRYQVVGKRKA